MENKANIMMLWELIKPPSGPTVVDEFGKVLPPSSQVFKDISLSMIDTYPNMTPKNIYTILLTRRYNVYDKLVEHMDIKIKDVSLNVSTLDSTGNASLSGGTNFSVEVTDLWPKIQPESVTYSFQDGRKRDVYVLRRKAWTSALYEKIHEVTKIPCALTFRNAKISKTGIFATVTGKCPECGCDFVGHIVNEPVPGEAITMECEVHGFEPNIKHCQKRQLKGESRTAIAKQLVLAKKLACQWRREEADDKMLRLGEKEPPQLYSEPVLRKAKQEMHDKLLDVKSSNLYESLHLMMYSQKYNGAIKRIGMNPLQVIYWTKDQEAVYDCHHSLVCIDGTGSLVKKITLPNGELCPHIYLYQMVTKVDEKTAPVCQMLSSAHSTDDILMWLRVFLKSVNGRVPKECVCDFDKALLGAVAQAFGHALSLKHYLAVCFEALMTETEALPPCFIRLDVCHFMNMIARWKCFDDKHKLVRTFYLRALAILRKQESVVKLTEIAEAILTLALEHNGQPDGHAEQARNFLAAEIRGFPSSAEEEVKEENEGGNHLHSDSEEDREIFMKENHYWNLQEWVDTLYRRIQDRIDSGKDSVAVAINGYYCPKLAKKLKTLLLYFPIFSEVMRGPFKYGSINATSAAVESEFNDLKNRTLKHVASALRVDKFVATHILSLPGKLKLALAGTDIDDVRDLKNLNQNTEPELLNTHHTETVPPPVNAASNEDENYVIDIDEIFAEHDIDIDAVVENELPSQPLEAVPSPVPPVTVACSESDDFVGDIEEIVAEGEIAFKIQGEGNVIGRDLSLTAPVLPPLALSTSARSDGENDVFDIEEMRAEHNWRNKNERRTKPFRYADPCPWFSATAKFPTELPIIPNGNICPLVRQRGRSINVSNTCAFDSICQILAFVASNNAVYKTLIEDSTSPIYTCVLELVTKGLSKRFFSARADLLVSTPHLKAEIKNKNIVTFSAASNIGDMASWMLKDSPSYIRTKRCTICECESVKRSTLMSVDFNKWTENGALGLAQALNRGDHPRLCCGQRAACVVQYGPHLIVETDIGGQQQDALQDFAVRLTMTENNEVFQLAGIVAYKGSYTQQSVGHYVAYLKTGSTWVLCDDTKPKTKPKNTDCKTKVSAHLCVYIREIRD